MVISCNGYILGDKIGLANSFFSRFKGLMGKKNLNSGEGLLLLNCSSVHCFFMKMTIDVIYLSKEMTVLGVETLAPWRIGRYIRGTAHVLELGAGSAFVSAGNVLKIYEGGKPYANIG